MPELTLPDEFRPGLYALVTMSQEAFEEFAVGMETERAPLLESDLVDKLTTHIQMTKSGEVENIVKSLVWFYAGRTILEQPSSTIARDASLSPDLELSAEQRETLAARLSRLLDARSLASAWKAIDVLTEHDRVFYEARIMTDVRPIFTADVTEQPAAALIIHMLKIHFHHAGRHDEVFVALNANELQELREVVERAEKKAESLKQMLAAAGVTYLDPGGS